MRFRSHKKTQWIGKKEIEERHKKAANTYTVRIKRLFVRCSAPYQRLPKLVRFSVSIGLVILAFFVLKAFFVFAIQIMLSLLILALFPVLIIGAIIRVLGLHRGYKPQSESWQEKDATYMEEQSDQYQWEQEMHWH